MDFTTDIICLLAICFINLIKPVDFLENFSFDIWSVQIIESVGQKWSYYPQLNWFKFCSGIVLSNLRHGRANFTEWGVFKKKQLQRSIQICWNIVVLQAYNWLHDSIRWLCLKADCLQGFDITYYLRLYSALVCVINGQLGAIHKLQVMYNEYHSVWL